MQLPIKVAFTDFWHKNSSADIFANPLYQLLSRYFDLELSKHPDFLIYSCFGKQFLKYDCTRIFFTGENIRPNFKECDFAFSFDFPVTTRNYRLPLYHLYGHTELLASKTDDFSGFSDRKFCNFIYSNRKATERIEFFHKLSQYKRVDSGGKVLNNIGGRVDDKLKFLQSYKFTIAFENACYPGYTTEKISEALLARTVPIYWGNPLVSRDFNPDSFINCHDFECFDAVIEFVRKVDADDELYHKYISASAFSNGTDNEFVNEDNLIKQLQRIFSGPVLSQVARPGDRLKFWTHPSRPWDFSKSLARRWKRY